MVKTFRCIECHFLSAGIEAKIGVKAGVCCSYCAATGLGKSWILAGWPKFVSVSCCGKVALLNFNLTGIDLLDFTFVDPVYLVHFRDGRWWFSPLSLHCC